MDRIGSRAGRSGWDLDHAGRQVPAEVERSDAARNRRRIVETARALFEAKGVTRVTMEEISREAGVGKGTLYRRFPHKGLLCQALLDEPTQELQRETLEVMADPELAPLEKLDWFLDRLAWFVDENLDLMFGGHEPLCGAERLAQFAHPAHDWRRSTVLGMLRAAARNGDLEPDLDLEYLATALLAPLEIDLFYHQRRGRGLSVERISAGLRSLVPACRKAR